MKKNDIAVVILAAGKGTRMKSSLPKVLHPILGRPMLGYVLDLSRALKPKLEICVLGHGSEKVKQYLHKQKSKAKVVIQNKLLGSGDAVKRAKTALKAFKGTVVVLYGDNPPLRPQTVKSLINHHQKTNAHATLLVAKLDKPAGYGRIMRDEYHNIKQIVEEKQANDYEKDIKEINTGICCYDKTRLFKALAQVKRNPVKKEYFLTDVINILYRQQAQISFLKLEDAQEAIGINKQSDLSQVEKIMCQRHLKHLMEEKGIHIVDPDTTRIAWDVQIKTDSVVFPFTVVESNVKIGKNCRVGPFCHLRSGVVIQDNSTVGNFTEISRSKLGRGTVAKHFCYLGDSCIGDKVNIGAGTVTANYDGKKKHLTTVKDNAFIGSDTVLIAPVKVGKQAVTAAGSVVTKKKDVSANTVVAGVPARPLKKSNKRR